MERFVPRLGALTKAEGLALISDAYPKLILPFIGAAGMLTARWYSEQKALPRSTGFAVEPAALPADEKLAASGRWALVQRDPVGALQGTASRSLFDQSRDTVLDNAGREGVRWARYASANACGFCRMLATRSLTAGEAGAPGLYRSERAALGSPHKKNARGHDHCKCLAVPVRSGTYEPPAYAHDWLDDYNAVSRDENGVLLPEWQIAARMERRADERMGRTRPKPGRPRKEKPQPDFDRLSIEAAPEPEKPAPKRVVKHLTKKSEQVDAAVKPLRDRVETAQRIANRADEVVNTAAGISSKVKQVTDVADKVLGGAVPIVRDVKTVVDTADKALQTAAQVTSGVSKVADAAATVVDSTVDIAHGVKQIADEVVSVLDDATAVALGVRALLADTGQAVRSTAGDLRNVRSVSDLADTIGDAVDTARRAHGDTAALVEDARGVVEATKGITEGIQELPLVLQKPIADVQELAQTVRDAVDDVDQFGDDAAALARAVKRLVDAVADWRRVEAATDEPRPPVFVRSERLDTSRAIGPAPKAIEAGGSDRLPAVRPRATVEPVTQPAGRSVFVRSERLDLPKAIEPKAGERAALPAGAEPKAIEAARTPALPAAAERKALEAPRRPVVDEEASERQRVLDRLDAEDEHNHAVAYWQRVDDELAKPFGGEPEVKPKPAASAAKRPRKPKRTLDDVERDMNAALETGDDALVDKLAAEMERIERRDQAAAERAAAKAAERAAARQAKADAAEAELRAKHDRIFELIEAGEDPDVAEAEVMGESLDTVRRRNFMRAAQAEGHHGNTFTKVLKQKYYQLANEAYQAAEDATNGNMLKPKFEGKVDPASLWSMSDRDARKYMSEEMAAWFDENGRLTFMAYRQAVLDGRGNWRNPLTEDYLQ
ncbi:capsid maturation protease [Mycobacterium phage Psycho]|uniref:Capsid maturation protease n=1 Tax=Mycobacterium phage Psycho TaxID=2801896 RepID=A0A7U0GCD0_9CAUD|nr:capsid maturation protease [Mycobacterium phage Psycho]